MKTTLERLIIKGVLKKLGNYFQLTIDDELEVSGQQRQLVSGLITSNDRYAVIEKIRKQQNTDTPFQFPFLGLVIENISLDFNAGKTPYSFYISGTHVSVDEDNVLNRVVKTAPAIFEGSIVFITDDFWQTLAFCSNWVIGSNERSRLNFDIAFHNIRFSITLELNTSVAFPQKDNTLDMVNIYEVSASISIKCFVADPVDFDNLLTSADVRKINVSVEPKHFVDGLEVLDLSDIQIN